MRKMFFSSSEVSQDELLLEFKKHYVENQSFIRSSIYGMVNSSDIDDLVQDSFVKAWRNYGSFENKSSFRTWIYRIAMNITYDYCKKNKIKTEEFQEQHEACDDFSFELSDIITKGLMLLPIDQREAFVLHYKIGLTYLEASKLLGIPEGTVKSRASQAKVLFVSFLKKNGVHDE